MNPLLMQKVVATLPAQLTPDTLYFVRTGAGFDLYLSDTTGGIAYPVNTPQPEPRVRVGGAYSRVVGQKTAYDLVPQTLVAKWIYFLPFSVSTPLAISGLRIYINTAVAGTAEVGVYANAVVAGSDAPGSLLAAATGLSTATTGALDGVLPFTFIPGELYWIACTMTAAATVLGCQVGGLEGRLGVNSGGAVITFLWASGAGMLPTTAPAVSVWGGQPPALYLLEV